MVVIDFEWKARAGPVSRCVESDSDSEFESQSLAFHKANTFSCKCYECARWWCPSPKGGVGIFTSSSTTSNWLFCFAFWGSHVSGVERCVRIFWVYFPAKSRVIVALVLCRTPFLVVSFLENRGFRLSHSTCSLIFECWILVSNVGWR